MSKTTTKSVAAVKKAETEAIVDVYYARLNEYRDSFHTLPTIVRETEKAVSVEAAGLGRHGGEFTATLWFPKSLLNEAGQAPGWMIVKKLEEITGLIDDSNARRFGFSSLYSVREEFTAVKCIAAVLSGLNK